MAPPTLPVSSFPDLIPRDEMIHSGWLWSPSLKKGTPLYFVFTANSLSCFTEKNIEKGPSKLSPTARFITASIGSHTLTVRKKVLRLTMVGKSSPSAAPIFFNVESDDHDAVIEWYMVLIRHWRQAPGVLPYNEIPPVVKVPDHLAQKYCSKGPTKSGRSSDATKVPVTKMGAQPPMHGQPQPPPQYVYMVPAQPPYQQPAYMQQQPAPQFAHAPLPPPPGPYPGAFAPQPVQPYNMHPSGSYTQAPPGAYAPHPMQQMPPSSSHSSGQPTPQVNPCQYPDPTSPSNNYGI